MRLFLFLIRGTVPSAVVLACFFSLICSVSATTNSAPAVTRQPVSGIAGVGEDFVFTVEASGTPPLSYQWRFEGTPLEGQTNSVLLLTNLVTTNSGFYFVSITNAVGGTNSSTATLTVQQNVSRRIGTGRIIKVGSQAGVPITFRATGRETNVSFSLAYTNAYSNPSFVPANNAALVNMNLTQPGFVGLSVGLPDGQTFPAGNNWLGLLQFDLAGTDPLQGRLFFTTNPVPIAARNLDGMSLGISAAVPPQFVIVSTNRAQLSAQSGLFEEQLIIGNPGATTMASLDILALKLGVDSRTNLISFFNAPGTLTAFPYGDPLIESPCDCDCGFFLDAANETCTFSAYLNCGSTNNCNVDLIGRLPLLPFAQINNLLPGSSRRVTLEFYVPDHTTVPHPSYSLFVADPLFLPPVNTTPLMITTNHYVNGTFIVEFPTQLNRVYYVQYAPNPNDLATNALTALPAISGTGSQVQWIDNGPPKTVSAPINGTRIYRVLESR